MATRSGHGRSPGARGARLARMAALRSSERLGRGGAARAAGALAGGALAAGALAAGALAGGALAGRALAGGAEVLTGARRWRRPRLRLRAGTDRLRGREDGAQRPGGHAGVRRARDRPHHGDALRARVANRRHVGGLDAADGKEGHRGMGGRVADELEAHGRPPWLGRGGMDGSDADVVGPGRHRRVDLLGAVGREADEPLVAYLGSGLWHRGIVLADVDAVGVDCRGQIRSVVEDEQRAVLGAQGAKAPAGDEDLLVVGVLAAQLHDVDAALEGGAQKMVGAGVADEVQPRACQPVMAVTHSHQSGRSAALASWLRNGSPTRGLRGRKVKRSADRQNLNRVMPAQGGHLHDRTSEFDLAVVGAGVIGLSVAWRAAQRGLRVVVLERDQPGAGSTHVAAGMLAPVSEALLSEQPLLHLGLASAGAYPAFIEELEELSGVATGYHACGTLLAARDADEAEALGRELAMRTRLGLTVRRLRASEARALEPALAPVLRLALEIPDDHAVDPRRLISALAVALARAGGKLRNRAEVTGVRVSGDRVTGVGLAGGEHLAVEQVVVASGAWGLAGLPDEARVPLRPVKGQILRMRDPDGPGLVNHVLRMHGGYLVPRGDGRYVLGATSEERGFDTSVTAGAVYALLRDATELLPGIGELELEEISAGLRPAAPDNAPVIGAGALPGLHWATAHYRNGVLLAPITAEALARSVAGEAPDALLAAFSPARFAGAATGELDAVGGRRWS